MDKDLHLQIEVLTEVILHQNTQIQELKTIVEQSSHRQTELPMFYNRKDVMRECGISKSTLDRMIAANKIEYEIFLEGAQLLMRFPTNQPLFNRNSK
jgi:hypothetical protein